MTKEKNTPLMQQYFDIKAEYNDALLLFQVGDFYELFFDDAKMASSYLALALTKRGKNKGEDIPLCGIPVHAVTHYLRKLIKGGFKVAICDQLSKPQPGTVVERGVTQVFTPGTLTDSLMLDDKTASYLLSFFPMQDHWGLLFSELLTAQLFATTIPAREEKTFEAELARFFPDEIVIPATHEAKPFFSYFKKRGYCTSIANYQGMQQLFNDPLTPAGQDTALQPIPVAWLEAQFNKHTLAQLQHNQPLQGSLTTLYHFLKKNNEKALTQFNTIQFYSPQDYVMLDYATQKNLELIKNNNDGSSKNTLFFVLDKAKTAMGSRTLKKWIQRPLLQHEAIEQRQEVIAVLCKQVQLMQQLEELLSTIADLERIIGRISLQRALVQDFIALKDSLAITPTIKTLLAHINTPLATLMYDKITDFAPLHDLLACSINDNPSIPYTIKQGFDQQLDHLRNLLENSQQEVLKLEQQEITQTGITSLKIRYNNITGYYIEITNANLEAVPERYQHLQTLSNRKRFTTPELKTLEQELYKAQHNLEAIENQVFDNVKREVALYVTPLRHLAYVISYLDGLFALAKTSYDNNYVKPTFNNTGDITIRAGRHPIIETTLSASFVGNDTVLNNEQSLLIITGPNMGGKSTYLRQVALICLMAQCGSFVPASQADLPIIDRIFTRIGSGDNLAEGKSTFLVEMEETATICRQATRKSLVILDEVGRGTSTNDGLVLAQAIIEFLLVSVGCKCLFATHYHELTELEREFSNVKNYSMQCKKVGNTIHFMHSIAPGVAHKSFGLEVARLAKLPDQIISRATELLNNLEKNFTKNLPNASNTASLSDNTQPKSLPLFQDNSEAPANKHYHELIDIIKKEDFDHLTPKKAFDLLWKCKEKLLE